MDRKGGGEGRGKIKVDWNIRLLNVVLLVIKYCVELISIWWYYHVVPVCIQILQVQYVNCSFTAAHCVWLWHTENYNMILTLSHTPQAMHQHQSFRIIIHYIWWGFKQNSIKMTFLCRTESLKYILDNSGFSLLGLDKLGPSAKPLCWWL